MNCKLVYAIIPKEPYDSLDDILTEKSKKLALKLFGKVDHTMRLEQQGTVISKEQIELLAKSLKENLDSRILDELGARLHHKLTFIHPFANGNGKHTRLFTDVVLFNFG